MNTQTTRNPRRERLLAELHELLCILGEPISTSPGETPEDLVAAAGISEDDLEHLVQLFRTDQAEKQNLQASPKNHQGPNIGKNFEKIVPSKVSCR